MPRHWRTLFKRINKGSGLPRKHILLVIVSPPSIQVGHTPLNCPYVFRPPKYSNHSHSFHALPFASLCLSISMEQQQKQQQSLKLLLSHLPPAQSPTSSSANIGAAAGDPPAEDTAALDFNVVVILAAMLCALVCALGLHSMLQCVIRCTQRVVTDPVEWVAARRLNTGLKKEDVVAIPTSTYAAPPPTSSPASSSAGCAICLADFSDGDRIRVIPICNHRFHVACIDTWLMAHSSCPTCRHRLSNHSHHHSSSAHLQIVASL